MPDSSLVYLRLLYPFLLALPILTLLPSPSEPPPELPGIRPVTIRTVIPRRAFTLTILSLLALTSFADAAILVADLLTANGRDHAHLEGLAFTSGSVYAIGGFLVWAVAAIVCTLGLVCEIPNLVLLTMKEVHTHGSGKLFTILSLPPSAIRVLLFPILFTIVSSPIIRYEPADETTGLLAEQNGGPSHGREAYGTFSSEGENGVVTKDANGRSVNPTGSNTPAKKQSIIIPKNLGEMKKEDKPLPVKEILKRLKKLSPYLWPSTSRKLQLFCAVTCAILILERIAQPLVPFSLGAIVRSLGSNQEGRHESSPWPPFILWTLLRLSVSSTGILSYARQRLWIPISQYTDREMMLLCFEHLLNLSLAYHTKRNTGEVLKIIDRGSAVNNLLQTLLFTAIPTIFDIAIAFGVFLYFYGGLLAFLTLCVMALYVVFAVTMTQSRVAVRRLLIDKDVKQRGIVSDVLTNWESVKYFTAEHREIGRFREAIVSYQETEAKWNRNWQLLYLIQNALLILGLVSGSLIIANRVLHGTADAAQFVVFIQYFQQLSGPLDRLGSLYRQLNQNTTDAEKMLNLLAQATEVNDKPGARDLVVTNGIIEFDNVCFSYDGKVEALKGVSFKIDKGRSMALVGESGSGKSTILRLLYRFYDITSGHIYIDGQDISEVTQVSLRRAIGIVPQDSVLWNDTIGANISYGKEGASDEEIIAAAEAARLHDRILSFTDDYSTVVGERGIRLSGGEKQRVSLARMFLKSPAILVLDEATSALDTETEREIQKALSALARGRSSLAIAHRLSTIINSDQIVVMKDGQVIENGGYKDLLDLNGAFASMWKKQIFTEAEMVAQAEGVEGEDAAKILPMEDHLVPHLDGDDVGEGNAARKHDETEVKGDAKAEETGGSHAADETARFAVDSPAPTATSQPQGLSSCPVVDDATAPPRDKAKSDGESDEAAALEASEDDTKKARDASTISGPTEPAAVHEPSDGSFPEHDTSQRALPTENDPQRDSLESASRETNSGDPPQWPTEKTAVPFPAMPRMNTSQSTRSNLSELDSGGSTSDLPDLTPTEDKNKDKRRKRLSSIKGFVRRMSDQGASRSPAVGKPGSSGKSPMGEVDEATAMIGAASDKSDDRKMKKKLSTKR